MTGLIITGAIVSGAATASAAWWFTPLSADPAEDRTASASNKRRREVLRRASCTYRWLEPLAQALAESNRRHLAGLVARLKRPLHILGLEAWRPEEYLAVKEIEGLFLAGFFALLTGQMFGWSAVLLVGMAGLVLTPVVAARGLQKKTQAYLNRFRARLPYALDLMALMLEAGAGTLRECLQQVVDESPEHPLGQELRRVVTGIDQGVALTEVLREMDERLDDSDVREMVQTVTVADERGTPLKEALRRLAECMRDRRTRWLEKSAEEARVHITWPTMVVMGACLLIVAAPLVLSALAGIK
jgi:Flp pilus assembly protein TadB